MLYITKNLLRYKQWISRNDGMTAFLSIAIVRAPPRNRLPHAKQLVITGILPLTQAAANRRNYKSDRCMERKVKQ
jgi:hypothetical protein